MRIAHRVTSSMGWRRCEPLEPADEEVGAKPTLNAGSPYPSGVGSSHGLRRLHKDEMRTI